MNYFQCQNLGIIHKTFFYIDVKDYFADKFFLKYKIKVKWTKQFPHRDSPYIIIFCKILKRDVKKFKMAMEDLRNKMLICGHRDYEETCKVIIKEIIGR